MSKSFLRNLLGIKLGVLYQHAPIPLNLGYKSNKSHSLFNLPTISLVTPSYNQGVFIAKTVESVLNQDYPNLTYVIQDGCSDDATHKVISSFPKEKLQFFSEPDKGQANAINRGFSKTNGEIMAWINSDDLLLPGALQLVGEFFSQNPNVDVVYGNRLLINEFGEEVGRWILPGHDDFVLHNVDYVPQETLFWRRSVWEKTGGYVDEKLNFAIDWDLLLRFLQVDAKFAHLPLLFGAFRVHEHQKTNELFSSTGKLEVKLIKRKYSSGFMFRALCALKHMIFLVKHKLIERQISCNR